MKLDISAAYNKAPGQMFLPFSLKSECPITLSTARESIQECQKASMPWIMAVVDDADRKYHFFDAKAINQHFEKNTFKNPANRQPVSKVHYFAMKSLKEYIYIETRDNQLNYPVKIDQFLQAADSENQTVAFLAQQKIVQMYLNEKQYKEAAYWLNVMVKMTPQYSEGLLQLSRMYFEGKGVEQDLQKALEYVDKALSIEHSIRTYSLRGQIQIARKEYDAAVHDFDWVENLMKDHMELTVDKARSFLRTQRAIAIISNGVFREPKQKKVAFDLLQAINEDATNADAHAYLGELYRKGRGGVKLCEEEADIYFQKALSINPAHAFAFSQQKLLTLPEEWVSIKKQKINK